MNNPTVFDIEQALHAEGFDLAAIRQEWMDKSREMSWPATAEGWRRWLTRIQTTKAAPKRQMAPPPPKARYVPPEFIEWWKRHREANYVAENGKFYGPIRERRDDDNAHRDARTV